MSHFYLWNPLNANSSPPKVTESIKEMGEKIAFCKIILRLSVSPFLYNVIVMCHDGKRPKKIHKYII